MRGYIERVHHALCLVRKINKTVFVSAFPGYRRRGTEGIRSRHGLGVQVPDADALVLVEDECGVARIDPAHAAGASHDCLGIAATYFRSCCGGAILLAYDGCNGVLAWNSDRGHGFDSATFDIKVRCRTYRAGNGGAGGIGQADVNGRITVLSPGSDRKRNIESPLR